MPSGRENNKKFTKLKNYFSGSTQNFMPNYPFYYKVKFHLLTRDQENNLEFQNDYKEFSNSDPLKAREEAFEEFEEYLSYLEENKKLKKDENGNLKIISPSGIPPEFEYNREEEDLQSIVHRFTEYMEFIEEIDILIVINDDNLMDEIGYGDRVFPIHTVASHSINAQELIDNLEMVELELYRRCGINVEGYTKKVQHYGEDYEESGEDEIAAQYSILPTPFVWQTKEQYLYIVKKAGKPIEEPKTLSWEKLIAEGETNTLEFKSSLVYNFSENSRNWLPLYNNARTICGFINCNGGLLLIGVSDDGEVHGIKQDLELLGNKDKIRLKIDSLLSSYFSNTITSLIDVSFEKTAEQEILVISVKPSRIPVFLKQYNPRTDVSSKHFFVRRTASTTEIKDVEEIVKYILNHWYPPMD